MIATIYFIALLLLIALGTPVGFSMAITGALGLLTVTGTSGFIGVLSSVPHDAAASYEFLTIPMFLLMAELVLASGIADDLFRAAAVWLARVPGGLGMATALAGAGFGAICGSSTASAATLSSTSLPAMLKNGYELRMAAGVVSISGTLAMLVPPSIAMIVYGLLADVSIAKMLIAGVIPGILITLTIVLTTLGLALWRPEHAPRATSVPLSEKLLLLRLVLPMLVLFAMVTGALYSGIATPTEASALGALGAAAIYFVRGRRTLSDVLGVISRATMTTCMIAFILIGAHIFSTFFALTQTTTGIVTWVGALPVEPWMIIVVLVIIYLLLGCFMDQMAILVLTIPVVAPLVSSLGFDLVWFGVIVIVTAELGMVTPPVGLNSFVVAKYARVPVSEVFWGVLPHFLTHIVAIAILLLFPALSLWLPSGL